MDFSEKIKQLAARLVNVKNNIETEEATKNALIMPFIASLGYDVFNPLEVIPEFVADVGVKKGEKVDYAIIQNEKPVILIECKKVEDKKLDIKKHATQLIRYFTVTDAKFMILTNGIVYKFFSDVDSIGKLDSEPFFTFNLANYKENHIEQLQKFCKSEFDIDNAFACASDLKYISKFEEVLLEEYNNPSADFVKYLITQSKSCEGRITPSIIEKHKKTTIEAFNLFMSKIMKNALEVKIPQNTINSKENSSDKSSSRYQIETTIEELEAYAIIKSMLSKNVDINRLSYKDTINYFNVILDDSSRKIVCRLYFNSKQKFVAFISGNKEEKIAISNLNDIYNYSEKILERINEIEADLVKK